MKRGDKALAFRSQKERVSIREASLLAIQIAAERRSLAVDSPADFRRRCQARIRTEASVESIIAAVYEDKIPKRRFNGRRLREDIDWANTCYRSLGDLGSNAVWNRRVRRLEELAATARRLKALLTDDEEGKWCAGRLDDGFTAPRSPTSRQITPSITGLKAGLTRLNRMASRELSAGATKSAAPWPCDRSPFECLAGELLPGVFEKWFGQKATASQSYTVKKDGFNKYAQIDTPYTKFAQAVLREAKICKTDGSPYEASSIAAAMKIKNGRRRALIKKVAKQPPR